MTGTGNDIVSLNDINENRSRQPGFYSKILSSSEKVLYNEPGFATIPFENFVWLLWSIKESAFKYLQRNEPDLIFSPTKFIVQQLEIPSEYIVINFQDTEIESTGFNSSTTKFCAPAIKGVIKVGTEVLYSRSIMYKELIASVVNSDENFENTSWGIKKINQPDLVHQSIEVRKLLINRLQRMLSKDDLVMSETSNGFPVVLEQCDEIPVSVSLSHHGHFVSYSFQTDHVIIPQDELRYSVLRRTNEELRINNMTKD